MTCGAPKVCKQKGIHYVDVGTSGGVWGLERGYCMMIGGPKEAVQRLDPIFKTLAPGRGDIPRTPGRDKLGGTAEDGYIHCGPSGSGTLREDGPQRHRVRHHAGLRRGLRHLQERDQQRIAGRPSLRSEPARYRGSLAARQRGQFVAARSDRDGADRESDARRIQRLRAGFGRRALDDSGGARRSGSGRSAHRPRCTRASARGRNTLLRRRCFPRCGRNSAATSNPKPPRELPEPGPDRCLRT